MLKKLPNLLLFLIIFLSSTQLGLHFWPDSSLVYGIRLDYLSPTLYLLDLLILFYLALTRPPLPVFSYGLFPLLLVGLLFSVNPLATLSWSLHVILYLIFLLPLRYPLPSIRHTVVRALVATAIFQVILAATQLSLGHSLQGPLYWFGERMVSVGAPNVAQVVFRDRLILRPYGTFSHPNVLAGWFALTLLISLSLTRQPKLRFFALIVTTTGVLLTQSRAAALALFVIILPFSFLRSLKPRLAYFSLLFLVLLFFRAPLSSILNRSDLAFSHRGLLQQVSLRVIGAYPVFGAGSQAALSVYPAIAPDVRLLQPDHNSFNLLFSWLGFFGILSLLASFRFSALRSPISVFFPLLPLLLLDHYLLTSPQGLFILLLYLKTQAELR